MPPQNTTDNVNQPATPPNTSSNQLEIPKFAKVNNLKQDVKFEEIADTAAVIVPPDGGWGWVVMIASFLCNVIVDGIVFNSGTLQAAFRKEFNATEGYITLVTSLLTGFYLMAGPFASALANRWGFRPVTMFGAALAAFGFGVSYFATSVEYLLITYGIIGGIGFCLIYIPSVISIGYYFEKWRALATGIALCGSGVGTFIFTPVNNMLIDQFQWRYTLVIQAGIILFCLLCGFTYRPIQPIQVPVTEDSQELEELNENGKSRYGSKPLPDGRFSYSVPNSAHNTYMGTPSNYHYPTAAEVFRGSTANLERRLSAGGGKLEHKTPRKSQPTTPNGDTGPVPNFSLLHKELTTVGENEEEAENHNLLSPEIKPVVITERRHTVSGRRPNFRSNNNIRDTSDARPMYRDDIFFTGSLVRIPQYTSQTSIGYHMSVTRLPTKHDVRQTREKGCQLCPDAVRRTLSTMLDVTLLKSPSFMLLAASGFLTMMGFFVPFIFVGKRALAGELPKSTADFIVPVIGITNTVARITCGLLSSFNINALYLNNIAITLGGIATIFSGYFMSGYAQYIYAIIFGICIACFSALRSIIAVELMGLEKLTNAFGFLMLFQGLAAAIGAPIAAVFFDATGSYDASFIFAGVLITISAVLCYPLNMVSNWEKKRAENSQNSTA